MLPLPRETQQLWDTLKSLPLLGGTILAGGTALAMHIGHRISEDLDFICTTPKLPRQKLLLFERFLKDSGFLVEANNNPAAYDEFLNAGMSLQDYQQDFLINNKTKITFFAEDGDVIPLLHEPDPSSPRVATLDEIFALKSLVTARCSKSRDWLDLYVLMTEHGYTLEAYAETFRRAKREHSLDLAMNRLCAGKPDIDDPGYEALMDRPPTIEQMKDYFVRQRDQYEAMRAKKKAQEKLAGG